MLSKGQFGIGPRINGPPKGQGFTDRCVHIIYIEDGRLAFNVGNDPEAIPAFLKPAQFC